MKQLQKNMDLIDIGAFKRCYALTDVYYKGDKGAISISELMNTTLLSAEWHYISE